jgi:hypothetical protein
MADVVIAQVWTGDRRDDPFLTGLHRVERLHGEPPFVRVGVPTKHPIDRRITIGRSRECSVVIDDEWVSGTAVEIEPVASGLVAILRNRYGAEHRTWGQQAQPLVGALNGSGPRPAPTVALHGHHHAFLFPSGERNELSVCVTLEIRARQEPEIDDERATDLGSTRPRRLIDVREVPTPQRVDRVRQVYWQFLVWPPRLRPTGVAPNSFDVQVGKDHFKVLQFAKDHGYALPERPTAVQPVLPEQLAVIGLLQFDEHALWRDHKGRIAPYLTDEEKYKRRQRRKGGDVE